MVLTSFLRVTALVHPVHAMNAEQRQMAVDLWTKPTDFSPVAPLSRASSWDWPKLFVLVQMWVAHLYFGLYSHNLTVMTTSMTFWNWSFCRPDSFLSPGNVTECTEQL